MRKIVALPSTYNRSRFVGLRLLERGAGGRGWSSGRTPSNRRCRAVDSSSTSTRSMDTRVFNSPIGSQGCTFTGTSSFSSPDGSFANATPHSAPPNADPKYAGDSTAIVRLVGLGFLYLVDEIAPRLEIEGLHDRGVAGLLELNRDPLRPRPIHRPRS
jgi:hypothetical protein